MEQVEKFIHWLNDNIVWGPVMLVLLVGTGIWLTLILRGLQFGMLRRTTAVTTKATYRISAR